MERDTHVPHDFSNNLKLDDGLEGDDDDGEEDEPELIVVRGSAGSKRGGGDTKPAAAGVIRRRNTLRIRPPYTMYASLSSPKAVITDVCVQHRWTPSPIDQ